ncbi:MAG TPA: TrkA C-terminal domain-containing protein [Phycisphaerae bacterium]|nr:TrkA C-terminal domain-containing protein [Phycisphaerae bacterium]
MSIISLPLIGLMLVVVGVTVLVVKAGGIALRLTGLDAERADFQALSAVTGTGFTTRESELVMADPRRRRIVGALMIFGNVVLVVFIGLLVGSFTSAKQNYEIPIYGATLLLGAYLVYRLLMLRGVTARWSRWIDERLGPRLKLQERHVSEVLTLAPGYGVAELLIDATAPCVGRTLAASGFRRAGLLVLAIRRADQVIPSPSADDRIVDGDRLVCYGELERMHEFIRRDPPGQSQAPEPPAEPPAAEPA